MLNIQKDIKLADYSTFRIGGPAKEFVAVKNESELAEALDWAKKNKLKFFLLGGGSNILFDSKGFNGIVIKMDGDGKSIKITKEDVISTGGEEFNNPKDIEIKCWAGESLASLVNFSKDKGITGLEWAAGIPGTIGGAIAGNAGAFGKCISDAVENVRVLKILDFPFPSKNKTVSYNRKKCSFGYRNSLFKTKNNLIILSITLGLSRRDSEGVSLRIRESLEKRNEKQPKNWYGCAGSFFKNPIVKNEDLKKEFEMETAAVSTDNRIPAGWIIDHLGLKGEKIGNIMVSDVNANFLINTGEGTSEEVVIAAGIIKQKARMNLGIQLKEEVKYVSY